MHVFSLEKLEGTFILNEDITLTAEAFFHLAQDRFSPLRLYKFSQFTAKKDVEKADNGGDGDSGFIYLKGVGLHIAAYFHSTQTHYCYVDCHSVGGDAWCSAPPNHWACCLSWYLPLIATHDTFYSYGTN